MPVNVVHSAEDEHKWERAKIVAAHEGQGNNYAYIMGIYKKMNPNHQFKNASIIKQAAYKALKQRLIKGLRND